MRRSDKLLLLAAQLGVMAIFGWLFAPKPPEVRGDVLLLVVDALKAAHPHYLGAPQSAH